MHSTCEPLTTVHDVNSSKGLLQAFQRLRERTRQIYDLLAPEAYLARPITLRHPFVFYDGHLDAFIRNTLFDQILGESSPAPELDELFRRGIDPASEGLAQTQSIARWPERRTIEEYKSQIIQRLEILLENDDWKAHSHQDLASSRVFHLLLEHEMMHQETLMYMFHQLPESMKRPPANMAPLVTHPAPAVRHRMAEIPEGMARLGTDDERYPFAWDNEQPSLEVQVSAFGMDVHNVTNGDFLAFVDEGGYTRSEFWEPTAWKMRTTRGEQTPPAHPPFWKEMNGTWHYHTLFETIPLPLSWPVMVTYHEAKAYARFAGKALPTEAEWHRALVGDHHDWRYPWGNTLPDSGKGHFGFDLTETVQWNPMPVGSFPEGQSVYGIHDLVGNGWEWTETPFAPFPGFEPTALYPVYSADFFDGEHFVMKGGSWFTDASLLRTSFRNWFYAHYPYMYATFRCVSRG